MVFLSCPNDARNTIDCLHLTVRILSKFLVSLSMTVDVLPRLSTGIRNLIRTNADSVAILFMKIGNDSMIVAGK